MNKKKLRSVMIEFGDTSKSLAEYLGISIGSLSKKMNEKSSTGFTQPEILMIKNRYGLTADQIDSIFFGVEVS